MTIRVHGSTPGCRLDFSANINPLGPPSTAVEAARLAMSHIDRYPDPTCDALKAVIAEHEGVSEANVACGNGAAELLFAGIAALKPARVHVAVPSFCEYQLAAHAGRAELCLVPPEAGCLSLSIGALGDRLRCGDLGIVCTPNNPTGLLTSEVELRALVAKAEAVGACLMVDEAFLDFVPDWRSRTAARLVADGAPVIVLRSMTKFYAIPGLRLGYALAPAAMVAAVELAKDPWSVNTPAQAAGVAALTDTAFAGLTRRLTASERPWLEQSIGAVPGFSPVAGAAANFILVELAERLGGSPAFSRRLLEEQGIAVRDCASFDALPARYIRVAVRSRAENLQLVQALRIASSADLR